MLLPADKLPPGRREWVSLAILFLVNLLNYMDRWIEPHQENRRNITVFRYTLSAVLVDFSSEMCPEEEGGCSFTKQGLLQTALVVVYLMVSPCHVLSFIVMSHVTIIVMCVHIVTLSGCSPVRLPG